MSIYLDPKVLEYLGKRPITCVDYNDAYDQVYPERRGESFEDSIARMMMTPIEN